jgi:hypothetical protein
MTQMPASVSLEVRVFFFSFSFSLFHGSVGPFFLQTAAFQSMAEEEEEEEQLQVGHHSSLCLFA